jgi:hypothetical protein
VNHGGSGNRGAAQRVDGIVDVATVILISLAALGTAWCSYQSARWSALPALNYSQANAYRVRASAYADRANAHRIVDVMSFAEYIRALDAHEPFAEFVRSRFTPPLKRAVNAWFATNPLHNSKAPPTPFAMSAYHLSEDEAARDMNAKADAFVEKAVNANDISDRYLFLTVLFAAASFLGGIAIKLRRPTHLVATCIGVVIFFVSIAIMVRYPVR